MKQILLLLYVVVSGCNISSNKTSQIKPNILWITIEDTSPQFIGCYGNKNARTPVIDRLANEGIRFTNAFSTGTVCSPSRTAIITGIKTYMTGTGHHRSKYPVPDYIKGFPYYLKELGYYTANNNKTDYNVANEKHFIKEAWNESSGKAGWWNRKAGQPFFAVFNFNESHQSRTMTMTYNWYKENVLDHLSQEERISENQFEMPPFYLDSHEMRRQFARVYNSISLTDKRIGELLNRLETDNLKDSTIIFFFADHGEGMPRGKTNGINYGYRVPFIIWFPEMYKHLSPWGTGGIVSDELIEFTDLAPTLVSMAGGSLPEHFSGRPFLGEKRSNPAQYLFLSSDRSDNGIDLVRTVTDGKYLYSRNFMPFIPEARYIRYMEIGEIKQQMRQDLKENKLNVLQKSLFESRPAEFLFDIKNDLWETENLAENPEYKDKADDMRARLSEEIIKARDIMLLPEYESEILSDTTTAFEFRLSESNYPISNIYSAARLSGFRGEEFARRQIDLLSDSNDIIRYWAILGLRSQTPEVLRPFSVHINKAMDDPYHPVAVTASAIVWEIFNNKAAEEKLKLFCSFDDPNIVLMTVNYLLYSSNKNPFIETIKNTRQKNTNPYHVRVACMDFLGSLGLVPNDPDHRE